MHTLSGGAPAASSSRGLKESPMMTRYAMHEPHRYTTMIIDSTAPGTAGSDAPACDS